MNNPLGLYVHIPFCLRKCRYCDFYSGPFTHAQAEHYTAELQACMRRLPALPNFRPFTSVYFGGGTPTALGAAGLTALLQTVKETGLCDSAEISFEANPATVDAEGLKALRRAGFNRVSFGVQSFSDRELQLLGRVHTAAEAVDSLRSASEAGFENINLDLMLNLPYQKQSDVMYSVEQALALRPAHISAYCLKLEPGTPLAREFADGHGLPTDEEAADTYLAVARALTDAGYEHYEISNFALPGRRCNHNMLYWTMGEYIGLGPSAHSFFNGQRFYFPRSNDFQGAAGLCDTLPEDTDTFTETVMLALRTADGLDLNAVPPGEKLKRVFDPLVRHGLALPTEKGYRLTASGWLVSNVIIGQVLDACER